MNLILSGSCAGGCWGGGRCRHFTGKVNQVYHTLSDY